LAKKKEDGYFGHYTIHVQPEQRIAMRRICKRYFVKMIIIGDQLHFSLSNPWCFDLYAKAQSTTAITERVPIFKPMVYALSYLRYTGKSMATMRYWLEGKRIDGHTVCQGAIVNCTDKYQTKEKCRNGMCYCYQPFRVNANETMAILGGPISKYICMTKSFVENQEEFGLHITNETNTKCIKCRNNRLKCRCKEDPSNALKVRVQVPIGDDIIVLGKDGSTISNGISKVYRIKDISQYKVVKQHSIRLLIPDGTSLIQHDKNKRFTPGILKYMKLYSTPRAINDVPEYNECLDVGVYKMLCCKINELHSITAVLDRQQTMQFEDVGDETVYKEFVQLVVNIMTGRNNPDTAKRMQVLETINRVIKRKNGKTVFGKNKKH
jgi:hypothetical protein